MSVRSFQAVFLANILFTNVSQWDPIEIGWFSSMLPSDLTVTPQPGIAEKLVLTWFYKDVWKP